MEHPFPDEPHQVAKEGTAAHWVAETCLNNPQFTPMAMIGQMHPNGILVDAEMAEHVDTYLEEVRSVVGSDKLYVEKEHDMGWIYSGYGGTPDAWFYNTVTGVLYIWDIKYGWRIVDPVKSLQMSSYLGGIIPFLGNVPINRIEAIIVQPRAAHPEGRIRRWHTSVEELGPIWTELQAAIQEGSGNNPTCRTGPHCRDCRALATCPYAQDAAASAIEVSGRVMHAAPTPQELAAEISILTVAKEAIALRLTALETMAVSVMESGGVVPGYAMERSYGKRRWKKPEELRAVEIMTGASLFEEKPRTPAQAKKHGLDAATLELYAETPESGHKLVKRDLSKKAAEVFGPNPGDTK